MNDHPRITRLSQIPFTSSVIEALRRIFFETSTRKTFASATEREEFRYRYLDLYLKNPDWVFLALAPDETILGYLLVATQTTEEVFTLIPSLEAFRVFIKASYPAHLHINLTESARGTNLGSRLLEEMETALRKKNIFGVHLVTTSHARNVSFYRKNLYEPMSETQVNGVSLLMLAKLL